MKNEKELIRRIGLDREAEEIVSSVRLSDTEYEQYKKLLEEDQELFDRTVRQEENYRRLFLHLYVRFAQDAYESYRAAGISDEIYFDTMKDLAVWTENCRKTYGETGIEESGWLWCHVTLRLFRLGRLQYEPEGAVLHLHIPQGEPLFIQACRDSLKQAAGFFKGYEQIICHSWLLNPELKKLLGKESNLVRFQELFTVYQADEQSRQAEERVFGMIREDPARYPETTTLQRNLKAYLMSGKRFGSAYGRIKE